MKMKIVLAGNPNSGKTTLFNSLTGNNQHIGNWPGVTVEKKEGFIRSYKDITVIDLPGIYSLSPYSLEEVISRDYILNEKPDVIINIVDGSNLERNLYLTTQLIETGVPVVIAINMMDVIAKNKDIIKSSAISKMFNCPVVEITALKSQGSEQLIAAVIKIKEEGYTYHPVVWYSQEIEKLISEIAEEIKSKVDDDKKRWYAIKVFEKDEKALEDLNLDQLVSQNISAKIEAFEALKDDDSESLVTRERYAFINRFVDRVYLKNKIKTQSISYKIDKVLTNKYLGLPIFAIIIFLVYYLSISTVGGIMTDFVNDTIFGDNGLPALVNGWLASINAWPWLQGVLVEGIIGGVGAVLGFLPQMFVLFLLLGILEESGYMARIAFILDKIFKRFGLSGKSFFPMLMSTGCGIPGVMAARTIEEENNRKLMIMTTTFMPCGAKLPIIALIAGAMFRGSSIQWLIAPSAYLLGIAMIIISSIILKKFKGFAGKESPFIMELPDYHLPSVKGLAFHVYHKLKSFVKKAGTIILLASVIVWFLSNFSWSFVMISDPNQSILASAGKLIDVIFSPLGWGNWKATVATFTGLIAKENVVSTFGVLYGFAEVSESGAEIWTLLSVDFTPLSSYSFLVFNLICAPCIAAVATIKREMGSKKWTWIAIGFQTLMAYTISLIIFQVGSIFTGLFNGWSIIGIILLIILLYLIFRPNKYLNISK
ncbi:MAG: ferrous iron transport protein B [Candidatus Izemoplasmatales bacterium]|nr:ferrous iron transport protein B [Candidatus Izemoplasmatales bacterium]